MSNRENTLNVDTTTSTGNPDNGPDTAADTGDTAGVTTVAPDTGNVASAAPTGTTGTGDQGDAASLLDAVKQANEAQPGTPEGNAAMAALTSAVEAATGTPVEPVVHKAEPKPIKARGETNKAYNKRVAAWRAGQPQGATPDKAEPKPQGGKATTSNPHTGAKAEPAKPAATTVTTVAAAKPAKVTPREAALADNTLTAGYDLSHWPTWCPIKPSREAIMAARALGRHEALTKSELAIATAIEQGNPLNGGRQCNVPDLGTAYNTVPQVNKGGHAKPDPKMVVINQAAYDGDLSLIKGACMGQNPESTLTGTRAKAVYGAQLTARGLKKVEAFFQANGLKVPRWLSDPHGVADEMAIAAQKAAKAAAKQAKSNVPA